MEGAVRGYVCYVVSFGSLFSAVSAPAFGSKYKVVLDFFLQRTPLRNFGRRAKLHEVVASCAGETLEGMFARAAGEELAKTRATWSRR